MATEVASIYARVGADMGGFKRGMSEFNAGIQRAGGAFRNFTTGIVQGIGQAFGNASIRMIREFGDAMTGTLKDAGKLEQGVADINALMGLTGDEASRVKMLISDIALDPKLIANTDDASRAIETLVRNGVELTDIMGGGARSTVLLSNASKSSFETSANVVTAAMQQFKIGAAGLTDVTNQAFGVTKNSKLSMDDYSLALSQAGAVVAATGFSFEDFNAMLAATAENFSGGSDAGTSFKTFVQRLTPDTKEAKEAMRALGLVTRDGTNAFYDSTGALRSGAEVSEALRKAFSGLTEEQKSMAAEVIFGTDGMRFAFGLIDEGAEGILNAKNNIKEANAEMAGAIRNDTLLGDWRLLVDTFGALSAGIGDKFLPHARALLQWGREMATRQGPALVEFFGRIANLLPGLGQQALGFFDMITGPGVTKTVTLLAGALVSLGKTLGELARPFRDAFQGLFTELAAMRGVGIVDIFKVIVRRLGVALSEFGSYMRANAIPYVRESFNKFRDQLYDWIRSVNWWEQTKKWASAFWEWAVDLWQWAAPYLATFWTELSSWVTDPAKREQLWGAVVKGWNVFTEWAGQVWAWMEPGLTSAWGWLSSWVTDPAKRAQLWGAIVTGWNVFTEWANNVWEWMRPGLTAAWGWLSSWVTDPAKREQLWAGVSSVWNVWQEWSASIRAWMEPGLIGLFNWLRSWIEDPDKRKQLWDGLRNNWEVWTGFALLLVPGMGPGLSLAWAFLHDWVTDPDKRARLGEGVRDWGNAITGFAQWLWEGGDGITGLKPILTNWWNQFKGWMVSVFPEAKAELDKLKADFGKFFTELDSLLRTGSDGTKRTWAEIWASMGESWDKGIAAIFAGLGDLTTIFTGVTKILRGFQLNEWGPIWEGIKDIASGAWSLLKRNLDVNPFFQGIVALFQKYGGMIKNAWNDMWSGMNVASGFATGLQAIIDTFNTVMDGFKKHVWSVMIDTGKRIMDGITEGIKNGQQILKDALNWVTSAMPDWVRNALGIRSPSKVFAEIGKNISAGLAEGIADNVRLPELSIKRMVKTTVDAPHMNWDQRVSAGSAGMSSRHDIYLHADTQLPTNRQALREIVIGLQRELQLTGARVAY